MLPTVRCISLGCCERHWWGLSIEGGVVVSGDCRSGATGCRRVRVEARWCRLYCRSPRRPKRSCTLSPYRPRGPVRPCETLFDTSVGQDLVAYTRPLPGAVVGHLRFNGDGAAPKEGDHPRYESRDGGTALIVKDHLAVGQARVIVHEASGPGRRGCSRAC